MTEGETTTSNVWDNVKYRTKGGRLPLGWQNWPLQKKIELLDPKLKEWISIYTQSDNATEATMRCYPKMNKNTAASYGLRVKKRPLIAAIIREMGAKIGITKNTILTALHEEIFMKDARTTAERMVRLKAIDTVAKMMDWYGSSVATDSFSMLPNVINYSRKEVNELLEEPPTEEEEIREIMGTEEIGKIDLGEGVSRSEGEGVSRSEGADNGSVDTPQVPEENTGL